MDCAITLVVLVVYAAACMTTATYIVTATGCSPLVAAFLTPLVPYVLFFIFGTVYDKFNSRPKR